MNPSSPPATAARLRALAAERVIRPEHSAALQRVLRVRLPWALWTERLLLALGAGLLLAGIIFFFAYNWATMPPWQKLASVEGAIVISALMAAWKGLDEFAGKISLFAGGVLTGVFLAVFGQIYQTGADTFELFLGWAALILPWVLLGRFGAFWILWLSLLNAGLLLSFLRLDLWSSWGLVEPWDRAFVIVVLNGLALAARELGAARWEWLREAWLRVVPLLFVFGTLTVANGLLILDSSADNRSWAAPVTLVVASGLAYWVYRWKWPDLFGLATVALALCIVLVLLITKTLFDSIDQEGNYLVLAVIVLAVFGSASWWLRREGRAMEKIKQEAQP